MSTLRGIHVIKGLYRVGQRAATGPLVQQVRNSGLYSYRQPTYENPRVKLVAKFFGAFAVWWIMWHTWKEPGHLIGEAEFPYPDPSSWTDEELGIPPDGAD